MELMSLVPNESSFEDKYRKDPRIVHNCEIPEEKDVIEALLPGDRLVDKIRRWYYRCSVLSENHPATRFYVKSSTAMNYEISRHITAYPYILYPFSDLRSIWETLMTVFTITALVVVPFILAFDFSTSRRSLHVLLFVDAVFAVDIVLWFCTGYYDDKTRIVILDRKFVASKYLKGFFILDFFSMFPIEIFSLAIIGNADAKWYYASLNLAKIFRLRTIVLYSRKLRYLYKISFQNYKIYEMTIIIMLCIHWATCLELYVALAGREIHRETIDRGSWIMSERMKDKDTNFKMYVACANRATVSLVSSSHYLDMKTTEDILLNLLLTVLGHIGFIYIIAQFLQLMTTFQSTSKRTLKLLRHLREYMQYKELPYSIQRRLLDYYKYRKRKNYDRDKYIIDQVSPYLREELLLHNYARLVDNVDYFQHLPRSIVARILRLLRTEVYLTNDVVVKSGTPGDALYFIASGTVALYTSAGREVCHLDDGCHFGEVSLVMDNEQRTTDVVAIEICEIWILRRADFLLCISSHPYLLNRLQKIAVDRLESSLRRRPRKYDSVRVTETSGAEKNRTKHSEGTKQ